jgi:hypothetical protein
VENVADNGSALTPTTLADLDLGTLAVGDALAPPITPALTHATVGGTLVDANFAGIAFGFQIALNNGDISNGWVNGATSAISMNLYNGSGNYGSNHYFRVYSFSGDFTVPAGSPLIGTAPALASSAGTFTPLGYDDLVGNLADLNPGTPISSGQLIIAGDRPLIINGTGQVQ